MARRSLGTLALALGLALLLGQPLAAQAFAHPAMPATHAAPAAPTAGQIGKAGNPMTEDLTLHLHSLVGLAGQPTFIATDAQGNVFISSESYSEVLMYDANDNFVRAFGGGIAPAGIAVSSTTVYVADFTTHRIDVFDKASGTMTTQFGASELTRPNGLALGSNGTLYVVDSGSNHVTEFSTSGNVLGTIGSFGSANGLFNGPYGIAASVVGTLYVTDIGNKRVQAFDLSGNYLTQWGSASFANPQGIAVDRAGMVYVVDAGTQTVYKFDGGGSLVGWYSAPSPDSNSHTGKFVTPVGVGVGGAPNAPISVYVGDYATGAVQRFDQVINPQAHNYQAQWGSIGSGNGQFNGAWGMAIDSAGNVYVSDVSNNRVNKFDQFGNFLLAFDGLVSGNQMSSPHGLALSPDGTTLYVVDSGNNRILEFTPSGGYLGQFGAPGAGNGQFNGPAAVATDGASLYVTDTGNNRIEVFDTNGTYQYQFGSYGTGDGQFNAPWASQWTARSATCSSATTATTASRC
ncbi:MAG TPA: hypothetical protein VIG30_18955 [Ktedonobacterales bacterium]